MSEWYERVPSVPNNVYERIHDSLKHYIYYKSDGKNKRYGYCTHCGEYIEVEREDTGVLGELFKAKHNKTGNCPVCDYPVTYIAAGRLKTGEKLNGSFYVAVFCPISFDEVWVRGIKFAVDFNYSEVVSRMYDPLLDVVWHQEEKVNVKPEIYEMYEQSRIRIVKGEGATIARNGWYGWKTLRTRSAEPFIGGCYQPSPVYHIENLDVLENTFLKYCCYDEFMEVYPDQGYNYYGVLPKPIKYMCEYARTPSLEMMLKFGGREFVGDYIYGANKHSRLINWKAKTPDKFFKLTKREARDYINSGCDKNVLQLHYDARAEGFTIVECIEYLREFSFYNYHAIKKCAKEQGITVRELLKYLRKQRKGNDIWHIYKDYLKFADKLKYDLSVHNVRYPKNLLQAHNCASAAYAKIEKQIEIEKYQRELRDRELRYNFALGNYTIFIPEDPQDIVKEGKALSHCVGGYVARHCEGKLTILFMRHIPDWNVPLYTIEMKDGEMRQVQGYNNRTENKPQGEAKAVLDTYLKWLAAGSPRNKDGRPKLNAKCRMQNAELRSTSA